ncbi:MAG: hypothetical protein IKU84_07065 [Clostridia bacterium]|nr:hypothetical protein [Clostridia bacterium]
MKKAVLLILAAIMMVTLVACGEGSGTITTTVAEVSETGNLILKADISDLEDEGIVPGNEVLVEIGDYKAVVLYNKNVLEGQGIEQMYANAGEKRVEIFTYEGNFAETYAIKAEDAVTLTKIKQPEA